MTADGFASGLTDGTEEYASATGVEARIIEALIWGVPGETEPERQKYARGLLETFAAARERVVAEKARADERERIAQDLDGHGLMCRRAGGGIYTQDFIAGVDYAARIARSQP